MTENSLVDRLRFAKEELTALKTAHLHGLNTLKVFRSYSEIETCDNARLVIDFDKNFAAYPLVDICGISGVIEAFSSVSMYYEFSSDGYTMYVTVDNVHADTEFAVISTSPVVNLNIEYNGA